MFLDSKAIIYVTMCCVYFEYKVHITLLVLLFLPFGALHVALLGLA